MGCQGSKATGTTETSQQPQQGETGETSDQQQERQQSDEPKEEEEIYVTKEQATVYVSKELGISDEMAEKVVASIDKNDDGKIANKELLALRDEINTRKEAITPKFAAYDKDGSGTVTTEEAYDVIKEVFPGIPESHVRAMVTRFDANNTGRMNFDEFVCFYAHICSKREKLVATFDTLDKDGSGSLAQEEVVQVVADQCAVNKSVARSLVEDFDQNNDGLLSKKEFSAHFSKLFA